MSAKKANKQRIIINDLRFTCINGIWELSKILRNNQANDQSKTNDEKITNWIKVYMLQTRQPNSRYHSKHNYKYSTNDWLRNRRE